MKYMCFGQLELEPCLRLQKKNESALFFFFFSNANFKLTVSILLSYLQLFLIRVLTIAVRKTYSFLSGSLCKPKGTHILLIGKSKVK